MELQTAFKTKASKMRQVVKMDLIIDFRKVVAFLQLLCTLGHLIAQQSEFDGHQVPTKRCRIVEKTVFHTAISALSPVPSGLLFCLYSPGASERSKLDGNGPEGFGSCPFTYCIISHHPSLPGRSERIYQSGPEHSDRRKILPGHQRPIRP